MKSFFRKIPIASTLYKAIRGRLEILVDERLDQRLGAPLDHSTFRLARNWASGLQPGLVSPNSLFGSNLCRMEDMQHPSYQRLCREALKQQPSLHRKQWEFVYIIDKLSKANCLSLGSRGLGFGVGTEPLASYFVSKGCEILATDAPGDLVDDGWKKTSQHAAHIDSLFHSEIVDKALFKERCTFMSLDMNDYKSIPSGFDFHWSSCVIEHLGGIKKATEFVLESAKRLAPGGFAVHTTEFNLSSDNETIDQPGTCILRGFDISELTGLLQQLGFEMDPIILDPGQHPYNFHVDVPPFRSSVHLRLQLEGFSSTSIGLVVHKPHDWYS